MGILDVEEFLATVPRRVLNFWRKFDRIEPIGEQWFQTALLGQELSRVRSTLFAVHGSNVQAETYQDFMPSRWSGRKADQAPKQSNKIALSNFQNRLEQKYSR